LVAPKPRQQLRWGDESPGDLEFHTVFLGLVAPGYPAIVVALRRWADRVERGYTE